MRINFSAKGRNTICIPNAKGKFSPKRAFLGDNSSTLFGYTIEKGDSLYGIARRYNINPDLLANLNGLNLEDYIYPDQEILIPKNNYSYYLTADGDTLESVARMFNVNKEKLLEENEIIYLLSDQLLVHKKN